MISVLIPTINRSTKIKSCLKSILTNSYQKFEILIIDQSGDRKTEKLVKKLNSHKLKYFRISTIGKSKALNFAIPKAKGDILAFTDDDCIVDRNWFKEIAFSFKEHKQVAGVVGSVWPYRPKQHQGEICVAITPYRKEHLVSPSSFKFEDLGLGNNMAFKKSVFRKVGNFKWWLGVGSTAKGGIESEFVYRVIVSGNLIFVNPNVKVFHNHWLKAYEEQKKQNQYACGFIAFCFYYLFGGDLKVLPLIWAKIKRRFVKRFVVAFKTKSWRTILLIIVEIPYYFRGLVLGFYFRLREYRGLLVHG